MTAIRFANRAELNAALVAGTFAGRAMHVMVLHDQKCTPERCTCEPEFIVEELTVDTYLAGQHAQAEWARSARS